MYFKITLEEQIAQKLLVGELSTNNDFSDKRLSHLVEQNAV